VQRTAKSFISTALFSKKPDFWCKMPDLSSFGAKPFSIYHFGRA
jgi:hypothetical protein